MNLFLMAQVWAKSIAARFGGERGQDLIEYALLSGIIATAIIAVGTLVLTGALTSMVNGIGRCIDFDSGSTCDV